MLPRPGVYAEVLAGAGWAWMCHSAPPSGIVLIFWGGHVSVARALGGRCADAVPAVSDWRPVSGNHLGWHNVYMKDKQSGTGPRGGEAGADP